MRVRVNPHPLASQNPEIDPTVTHSGVTWRCRVRVYLNGTGRSSRKAGSPRLLDLTLCLARLPDREQDSAHDVLCHAAGAKLIQLKRVLPSIGTLLGQVPNRFRPEDKRNRIRASYGCN